MKILFVCSGNTCRSPLAEGLARKMAAERGLSHMTFASAGTGALDGGGASEAAILVALERGIDLSSHRIRSLTRAALAEADLVLVMGPHHLESVRNEGGEGKAHLLDHFASSGQSAGAVLDPFGGTLDTYRETAAELEYQIGRLLDRLTQKA
ncbi:low molecular weight protein arginine phosphatase [soil metagenome]